MSNSRKYFFTLLFLGSGPLLWILPPDYFPALLLTLYLCNKELQCDRSHGSDEDNDGEEEIVQVSDGARMDQDDADLDLDTAYGADAMNEERSECDESDGSGSENSSVDCDNRNPFKE